MDKKFIRKQFNQQANRFAQFELTRNEAIFEFIHDFCRFDARDTLLDIACGSGDFVNFCSKKIKAATGVDLSENLIQHAIDSQSSSCTYFLCGDAENLPFRDAAFTLVSCRSAFHHMETPDVVIKEMLRALAINGKICIQDMTAFTETTANRFFEKMETLIDPSHHQTLSTRQIQHLLMAQDIRIIDTFESTLTFNLNDYIGHALQDDKQLDALSEFIGDGLSDSAVAEFLFEKEGSLFFKRNGIVIYGEP